MNYGASIICSCYRGEKYLPLFLESYEQQTIFSDCELVIVHNDPTPGELDLITAFQQKYPYQIQHIIVEREPISVSMNRAILASSSDIIVNRDIDDLRTPDSVEQQVTILRQNDNIYCSYGDFTIVNKFGSTEGNLVTSIEYDTHEFRQSMHCGPFRAWKKSIHQTIGYFDEQLKSGADFDLMIRIAYHFDMKKTQSMLGYYLNANTGLSTGSKKLVSLQEKELRVINERYHIHNKIDYLISIDSTIYTTDTIKNGDKTINIHDIIKIFDQKKSLQNHISSSIFTVKQGLYRIAKYYYLFFIGYINH